MNTSIVILKNDLEAGLRHQVTDGDRNRGQSGRPLGRGRRLKRPQPSLRDSSLQDAVSDICPKRLMISHVTLTGLMDHAGCGELGMYTVLQKQDIADRKQLFQSQRHTAVVSDRQRVIVTRVNSPGRDAPGRDRRLSGRSCGPCASSGPLERHHDTTGPFCPASNESGRD